MSVIAFTLCTTLYDVQQTPFSNFCFSNVGSLIKVILHEPCKNSAQKRCVEQFAWLMTFYNPAHIRETTKSSQWCLYAHVQSGAECKTFDRHNKSQEQEVCFLEIRVFLNREEIQLRDRDIYSSKYKNEGIDKWIFATPSIFTFQSYLLCL